MPCTRPGAAARGAVTFLVCAVVIPAIALGCAARAATTHRPFEIHWAVTTDRAYQRTIGQDLQALVDLDGLPIARDARVLYAHHLGNYPHGGPHLVLMSPDYLERHLAKLADDLDALVPDRAYRGLAIIDYESWGPIWEWAPNDPSDGPPSARDRDVRDDWEEFLVSKDPNVFRNMSAAEKEAHLKATYDAAAKMFLLATIRECKRLRPNARWGIYNCPPYAWTWLWSTDRARGDARADQFRRENDSLRWLYDELDFMAPSLYARRVTRPGPEIANRRFEATAEQNQQMIRENIREAIRVAQGKPVYPFVWLKYHGATGAHAGDWVNDADLHNQLVVPAEAGAHGVLLWDHLRTEQERQDLEWFIRTKAGPVIERAASARPDLQLTDN